MNKNFETVTIEGVSSNISEKFDFIKNENAIFLNTSDVLNNQILHMDYSNSIDLPGQAKKAIRKYDILLSEIRPGNKRFAYIDLDPKKFVVSTKFMVIRSHQNICSKYLFLFLTSKKILNQLQYIAERRSGTFPQITFDAIKHIELKLFKFPA